MPPVGHAHDRPHRVAGRVQAVDDLAVDVEHPAFSIGARAALRAQRSAAHPGRVERRRVQRTDRRLRRVAERRIAEANVGKAAADIDFHAFYRELVQALYDTGATRYVFCVNVDAVIAALLLAILWRDYRSGALTEKNLETAAFNVFLYGRMIGAAAEIDDHLNRGRNMDTRTPQEQCVFVV